MLTLLSEANTISEIEIVPFKEQILKFDELCKEKSRGNFIHSIKETRQYFWKEFKLNKNKFDRLFTGLLAQRYRNPIFNLHGTIVGHTPQKDFIELPTELCPYKGRTVNSMFFSLWSITHSDDKIVQESGK